MTDLLTTKQVQTILRVDRTTIYRMVESGHLPALRVGKQWRFARGEVEQWLRGRGQLPVASAKAAGAESASESSSSHELRALLPVGCTQLIQDACAEMLGVMMVITDMQGQPVTAISNPCGFFLALTETNPAAVSQCVSTWQQLAGDLALAPKFSVSEMGLLCARGVIRVGAELKGMVVVGGIAPEAWPPSPEQAATLARVFASDPATVQATAAAVYYLDDAAQERVLRFVQRIADIFSHILEDRSQVQERLQAIASLTAL